MATISTTYAIMEKGKLKAGGWMGKTGWAFIHVLYLGRAEGQLMLCLQWLVRRHRPAEPLRATSIHRPTPRSDAAGTATGGNDG